MSLPIVLLALCLASAPVPSPHTPITPGQPTAAGVAREPVEARRARGLRVSGALVLMSTGLAWGMMFGGLVLGAQTRRAHNQFVAGVNAADRPLAAADLEQVAYYGERGANNNAYAIAGAAVGAALTIVGAVLLGRGLASTRRQARFARPRNDATWGLRF